jgi:hypothetical protein
LVNELFVSQVPGLCSHVPGILFKRPSSLDVFQLFRLARRIKADTVEKTRPRLDMLSRAAGRLFKHETVPRPIVPRRLFEVLPGEWKEK